MRSLVLDQLFIKEIACTQRGLSGGRSLRARPWLPACPGRRGESRASLKLRPEGYGHTSREVCGRFPPPATLFAGGLAAGPACGVSCGSSFPFGGFMNGPRRARVCMCAIVCVCARRGMQSGEGAGGRAGTWTLSSPPRRPRPVPAPSGQDAGTSAEAAKCNTAALGGGAG